MSFDIIVFLSAKSFCAAQARSDISLVFCLVLLLSLPFLSSALSYIDCIYMVSNKRKASKSLVCCIVIAALVSLMMKLLVGNIEPQLHYVDEGGLKIFFMRSA